MIEPAIIIVRLLQYTGASILLGSSLFMIYALPGASSWSLTRRASRVVGVGAALLAMSSLAAIGLQASLFTGSLAAGFTAAPFADVVSFMALGKAAVVRAGCAALALMMLLVLQPTRARWVIAGALGAIATTTLAWLGHGGASDSWVHLVADMIHSLAAALWIGGLAGFLLLFTEATNPTGIDRAHTALLRFSAIGVPLVGALVLSGLLNSWFVIGPDDVLNLPFKPYGQLLLLKLIFFAAMVALAMANRNRLTPALKARPSTVTVGHLRRSIAMEAGLGILVLALVAWLGTLEPPASF